LHLTNTIYDLIKPITYLSHNSILKALDKCQAFFLSFILSLFDRYWGSVVAVTGYNKLHDDDCKRSI
jgi:hypothetical protein